MLLDRNMKRGGFEYLYSVKVAGPKSLNTRLVTMIITNVEGIVNTSTVPRRQKGSASKIQAPFPHVIEMVVLN